MASSRIPGPLGLAACVVNTGTLARTHTPPPGPLGGHPRTSDLSSLQRGALAKALGAQDRNTTRTDPEGAAIVASLHGSNDHIAFEGLQLRFVQSEHWNAQQRAQARYHVLSAIEAKGIVSRLAVSPLTDSQMREALVRAAPRLAEAPSSVAPGKILLLYRAPDKIASAHAIVESITLSEYRRRLGKRESHRIEFNFETVCGHRISDSQPYLLTHPDGSSEIGRTSNGTFHRENVDEGRYRLQFCRFDEVSWNTEQAQGEPSITMAAETVLFPDGTPVQFAVYRHAPSTETPLFEATGTIQSDRATAQFQYRQALHENPGGVFVFLATIGEKRALSSNLTIVPHEEDSIGWIQQRLKALGHDPGPISGVSGTATTSALRDFQSSISDLVESGTADPDTLIALATI